MRYNTPVCHAHTAKRNTRQHRKTTSRSSSMSHEEGALSYVAPERSSPRPRRQTSTAPRLQPKGELNDGPTTWQSLKTQRRGVLRRRLPEGEWRKNASSSTAETKVLQSFHPDREPPPLDLGLGANQIHNIFPWHWDKHTGKSCG